jgi:hypothetical protein
MDKKPLGVFSVDVRNLTSYDGQRLIDRPSLIRLGESIKARPCERFKSPLDVLIDCATAIKFFGFTQAGLFIPITEDFKDLEGTAVFSA